MTTDVRSDVRVDVRADETTKRKMKIKYHDIGVPSTSMT